MTGQDNSPKGPQPETLAEFDAAARKGGVKPGDVGTTATP